MAALCFPPNWTEILYKNLFTNVCPFFFSSSICLFRVVEFLLEPASCRRRHVFLFVSISQLHSMENSQLQRLSFAMDGSNTSLHHQIVILDVSIVLN